MYRSPDISRNPDGDVRRLLIVDDEPTLRFGFAYALTTENTVADTAANGTEALDLLDMNTYDAVVLDLRMPEMDGLAVIESMRSKGIRTPVILCSAFITLHSALLAIQNQVVDFLMKPVKPEELRKAVAGVMGDARTPLENALGAVRRDQVDQAIEMLKASDTDDENGKAWLKVLSTLRRYRFKVQETEAELDDPLIDSLMVR